MHRWFAVVAVSALVGFVSHAHAAPKDKARPKPKTVTPSATKRTPATSPPTFILKTQVGPSAEERRLMTLLPSLVNGKMNYACGDKPCSFRAETETKPQPSPSSGGLSVTPSVSTTQQRAFIPVRTRGGRAGGVSGQVPCRGSR